MRDTRRLTDHPLFRLLVLALLSVPLVILVTTPRQKATKPDALQDLTQQQVSEPDSYMTGLHLKRFNPEGRLQYEFHARRAFQPPQTRRREREIVEPALADVTALPKQTA